MFWIRSTFVASYALYLVSLVFRNFTTPTNEISSFFFPNWKLVSAYLLSALFNTTSSAALRFYSGWDWTQDCCKCHWQSYSTEKKFTLNAYFRQGFQVNILVRRLSGSWTVVGGIFHYPHRCSSKTNPDEIRIREVAKPMGIAVSCLQHHWSRVTNITGFDSWFLSLKEIPGP